MKKLLLATSALIASATIANAQAVTITGEGRMGVMFWTNGVVNAWTQENRLQLNFNVSVQADHGLTFGAWSRVRTQSIAPAWGGPYVGVFSGSRVWVEASGFRLTFGNVDGAVRGAGVSHGYAGGCGVGYEGGPICADTAGLLFVTQGQSSTGGGPASRVRIDYTMGDTRVAVSHDRGGATELGVRTSFDAFTVAAGYSNIGTGIWTISGHYNGGAWGAGAIVSRIGASTNYSVSGNVGLGGGDLYAYVGRMFGAQSYGVSYGYGLGGGATATIGAERWGNLTMGSVGVAFNF